MTNCFKWMMQEFLAKLENFAMKIEQKLSEISKN